MRQETKDLIEVKAAETLDWLRNHPAILWFVGGFFLGWLSGCSTIDYAYWCLRSAPELAGPFCP